MKDVYLLIGGNMGDRMAYFAESKKRIGETCGTIASQSFIYETEAWGLSDQAAFLNQALCIQSAKDPESLIHAILRIEESLGRKRQIKYGPRLIDIDIIFYSDAVIRLPHLTVPHPQVQNRRFALQCLNDIAPDFLHPLLKKTVRQLLAECPDTLKVKKFQ